MILKKLRTYKLKIDLVPVFRVLIFESWFFGSPFLEDRILRPSFLGSSNLDLGPGYRVFPLDYALEMYCMNGMFNINFLCFVQNNPCTHTGEKRDPDGRRETLKTSGILLALIRLM